MSFAEDLAALIETHKTAGTSEDDIATALADELENLEADDEDEEEQPAA